MRRFLLISKNNIYVIIKYERNTPLEDDQKCHEKMG